MGGVYSWSNRKHSNHRRNHYYYFFLVQVAVGTSTAMNEKHGNALGATLAASIHGTTVMFSQSCYRWESDEMEHESKKNQDEQNWCRRVQQRGKSRLSQRAGAWTSTRWRPKFCSTWSANQQCAEAKAMRLEWDLRYPPKTIGRRQSKLHCRTGTC